MKQARAYEVIWDGPRVNVGTSKNPLFERSGVALTGEKIYCGPQGNPPYSVIKINDKVEYMCATPYAPDFIERYPNCVTIRLIDAPATRA